MSNPAKFHGEGHRVGAARNWTWRSNLAAILNEHTDPDWIVMRILDLLEARMGVCETISEKAFSFHKPATVLGGVKVVRPVGRSTLTPAAVRRDWRQREGGG